MATIVAVSIVSFKADSQAAVPIADVNSAGDIPDAQVFITYRAPGMYRIDVPEGWARVQRGSTVLFTSKLDGESISVVRGKPSKDDVSGKPVTLPGGLAFVREYRSTAPPNAVTGKRIELASMRYAFVRARQVARLTLWAPSGAGNADQWRRIARSFRWE